MMYHFNLIKFFFPVDDHLFRIQKAEKIANIWKLSVLLVLVSAVIYGWMGSLGMGTDLISKGAVELSVFQYQQSKLWFVFGRIGFGIVMALFFLFVPALIFHLLTDIPYQKLVIMQQIVLLVMLIERVIWIPLFVNFGLDWYVSPLSFGIIVSYLTEAEWPVFFFGAVTLFQLWIIWFQIRYLSYLSTIKKSWIYINVISLHIFYWLIVAFLAYFDRFMIGGWFG
ncbi:hypothetical protein CFK37_05110 [Virgibacillus phasianinus]|uniref:Yip1 domain-containing protein n=1 Tax=Virgibacillus phasianinus TaxID=2017483 RepID=A0A220U0E2_9BACI|nr:hypothetical protein [Virgibacillus phasianinus]ASK61587.1 hypothetical protein CFK37_05110 [Virgibacillus phasianinus]